MVHISGMEKPELACQDLCREALDRFGVRCFDNLSIDRAAIGEAEARLVARHLRLRGGREGFLLGRRIEALLP